MGFISTIIYNIKNMKKAKKYRAMGKENLLALSDDDFFEALEAVGASELKGLFDQFIKESNIDVNDLSSFKIQDLSEFKKLNERFDFDSFDERFYEDAQFHQQVIDYEQKNRNSKFIL